MHVARVKGVRLRAECLRVGGTRVRLHVLMANITATASVAIVTAIVQGTFSSLDH